MSLSLSAAERRLHHSDDDDVGDDDGQSVDVVERRTRCRVRTTCSSNISRRPSLMILVIYLLLITAVLRVDAIKWL